MNQATISQWPALYDPVYELYNIQHQLAIQPAGRYLHAPYDIFVYTFYWTLAFYTPPFIAAAFYAFLNLSCPPARRLRHVLHKRAPVGTRAYASQRSSWAAPPSHAHAPAHGAETEAEPMLALVPPRGGLRPPRAPRANARRSRLAFALLVLFVYAFCALVGAVVGAFIGGYVLAGLYRAGGYHMSTWIPLVYALTHSLVGTLGLWSSAIDII